MTKTFKSLTAPMDLVAFKAAAGWFASFDCVVKFSWIHIFPRVLCIRTSINPKKWHLALLTFFSRCI